MTANRWWVRLAARWLARIDGVTGQIQMVSLSVTAFSTFGILLQNYGLGGLVPYLGAAAAVGCLVYVYLYTEGGVWNQVAKDRQDLSTDFSGPTMKMDDTLIGVAVFAAIHERPPTKEEIETIETAVDGQWKEYRDGVLTDDD